MAVMATTYRYPVLVAPSSGHKHSEVVVDVACGAGANDDDTPLVHGFNLSPADGSVGQPRISFVYTAIGSAATLDPTFAFTNKDTVTITASQKGANCNFTARVTLLRPHSTGR